MDTNEENRQLGLLQAKALTFAQHGTDVSQLIEILTSAGYQVCKAREKGDRDAAIATLTASNDDLKDEIEALKATSTTGKVPSAKNKKS